MNILSRTEEEVKEALANSSSMRELQRNLGYSVSGATSRMVQKMLDQYGLATPSGNKRGKARPLEEILVADSEYLGGSKALKNRLVAAGFLSYICSGCNNPGEWNGLPLTLQLDHINGKNDDNRLSNLRLLCPNCHCQTETWGMKSRSTGEENRTPV